jgi:mRNA interferase MazF
MDAFPRRGEVWLVDFSPSRGSEQRGLRPALVIQNDVGNEYAATTIVAAITSTVASDAGWASWHPRAS